MCETLFFLVPCGSNGQDGGSTNERWMDPLLEKWWKRGSRQLVLTVTSCSPGPAFSFEDGFSGWIFFAAT
jgi:hypothetical protein